MVFPGPGRLADGSLAFASPEFVPLDFGSVVLDSLAASAGDVVLLSVSPASLSFHLKEMAYAGLIQARQDGRYIIYSAHFEQMTALLAYLSENCCAGAGPEAANTACCPPKSTGASS